MTTLLDDRSTAIGLQIERFGDTLRRLADDPKLPVQRSMDNAGQSGLVRYFRRFHQANRDLIREARQLYIAQERREQ